jgi:hydroxymethylpyrimidine/phosphomethylpyrimidine kinase
MLKDRPPELRRVVPTSTGPMNGPIPHSAPVALCLGGLDPSGGAGLLRDALTLAALGVHPMAIPTAETLQNGVSCLRIEAPVLPPTQVLQSLVSHLGGAWGVKVGLWALDPESLAALGKDLAALAPKAAIWDPILGPTSGVGLHDRSQLARLARALFAHGSWVVSPNRNEAATLAGLDPLADPEALAAPWLALGAAAVWLKGGHGGGETVEDWWITASQAQSLGPFPRLPGERRGTGCTLAAAWLGLRLGGRGEIAAAREAAAWLRARWDRAFAPGGAGRPLFGPEVRPC